jgi:pyruvate dehydrogenase E1 component alpha subunit
MQNKDDISVTYFGDGAIEEGVVHESLNLARQLRVPVLFVCENNLFSSHMHISQRQPLQSVARFSIANDITTEVIDGNNILNVENAASKLIAIARKEKIPVFIEAITYRHYGHVDWREDIDVGINRSPKDLKLWKLRELIEIKANITNEIDLAWKQASDDHAPELKSLFDFVYKD